MKITRKQSGENRRAALERGDKRFVGSACVQHPGRESCVKYIGGGCVEAQIAAQLVANISPEQRECRNAAERKRFEDPEYRERKNAAMRKRREDPVTRERYNAAQRVANMSPERRERQNAAARVTNMSPEQIKRRDAYALRQSCFTIRLRDDMLVALDYRSIASGIPFDYSRGPTGRGAHACDHCHERNVPRGVITQAENQILGLVKDRPELLRKIADFLEENASETLVEFIERVAGFGASPKPKKEKERRRARNLKRACYTIAQYNETLVALDGTCPACHETFDLSRGPHRALAPNADHCHTRSAPRAPIHGRCNTIIGLANDDPKILRALAKYLERNKSETDAQFLARIA